VQVLVDSSVWIDYFKSGQHSQQLDVLIQENLVVTNEIILSELIPFLRLKNQRKVTGMLEKILRLHLDIDWKEIREYQFRCIKRGINGVGIPDLIIAQNAIQHICPIYSLESHFEDIYEILDFDLF